MRKLASIRVAAGIFPIVGADAIEAVKVDGWVCVSKKGEFKEGDLGVYFEIDSFLPSEDPRFSFLEKQFITYYDDVGARLRTVRLRGQLSQGLFLPLSLFPELQDMPVGSDVSEILKIKKWEAIVPTNLAGDAKGGMPSYIKKTDQERIQNLVLELQEQIGQEFEVTIKLDGTSMTVYRNAITNDKGESVVESGVCGRNWDFYETPGNSLWQVARKNRMLEALEYLGKNYAFQGELIGMNIQENPEKLKFIDFYLFEIFDIDNYTYLPSEKRLEVLEELKEAGFIIKSVPVLDPKFVMPPDVTVESLLKMADGPSLNPNVKREGLVFKRKDGTFSFKVISDWYLEKHSNR